MSQLTIVILISWMAGVAAYAGGVLAWSGRTAESKSKGELVHGAVEIVGGILVAAVAFALVPTGLESLCGLDPSDFR